MKKIKIFFLKNCDYNRCTYFQNACRENLLITRNKSFLIIATHNNVITYGKNKITSDLLVNKNFLDKNKIDLIDSSRGGKITCHGKGQVVFYPIINLKDFNLSIREYVHILEKILIETLEYFHINAIRQEKMEGVFVTKDGCISKIGFIGIHIKKYHSLHGISVNIENDILSIFKLINPCGYKNLPITSVEEILNKKISYNVFINYFINIFLKYFNFTRIDNKCKLLVE